MIACVETVRDIKNATQCIYAKTGNVLQQTSTMEAYRPKCNMECVIQSMGSSIPQFTSEGCLTLQCQEWNAQTYVK